jgi:peptidoglycan hydrolase-like protein with peptidoglycan-binding domain
MAIDNQTVNADSPKRFIEMVQRQLIRENPSALPNYGVDGSYGPETTDWVERFQERKGLQVDGIAGPETLGRFREDIVQRPNTSGRGVEILQEDLLWFYIQQSSVDGSYGPGTTQGVRDFQFLNNLVVDGIAGPNTLKRMDELLTQLYVIEGDSGSLVRRVQNQLNEQDVVDISLDVDGSYGPLTKAAVEKYQDANDLNPDGVAGPRTMYLLNADNLPLFGNDENKEELEALGLSFNDSSEADIEKFSDLFRNHPEIIDAMDGDVFDNVYTTEMDYANGSEDNKIVVVVADVEGKPNLAVAAQFFKQSEQLKTFTIMNIFGNLPDDDVEMSTYTIDDDGVSIDTVTTSNVDLEDSILQTQIGFQEAIQQSRATGTQLVVLGCSGGIVLSNPSEYISTQDWTDIIGITCDFVIGISAGALTAAIGAAFGVATGPLAITTLIVSLIASVGAYYFCDWLEGQFG